MTEPSRPSALGKENDELTTIVLERIERDLRNIKPPRDGYIRIRYDLAEKLPEIISIIRTLEAKLEAQAKLLEKCRSAFGIEGANPEYHRQCREWLRDKWKPLYEALSALPTL